jgi:cellulase
MSKVADASTADGSSGWFKIFEDGWTKKAGGYSGDDDQWGVKDLNACCGKMDVKIPSDIAPGDYLLRAEVIALHTAGQSGGAQLYMSCYQLTVSGSGTATPATVKFPGAYKASDPGIMVNIHSALSTYVVPGPPVYSGGTTKTAGSGCSGCAGSCKAGSGLTGTAVAALPTSGATQPDTGSGSGSSGDDGPGDGGGDGGSGDGGDGGSGGGGDEYPGGGDTGGGDAGCAVQAYGQCGGNGYSGCTSCGVSVFPTIFPRCSREDDANFCLIGWCYLQGDLAALLLAVRAVVSRRNHHNVALKEVAVLGIIRVLFASIAVLLQPIRASSIHFCNVFTHVVDGYTRADQ